MRNAQKSRSRRASAILLFAIRSRASLASSAALVAGAAIFGVVASTDRAYSSATTARVSDRAGKESLPPPIELLATCTYQVGLDPQSLAAARLDLVEARSVYVGAVIAWGIHGSTIVGLANESRALARELAVRERAVRRAPTPESIRQRQAARADLEIAQRAHRLALSEFFNESIATLAPDAQDALRRVRVNARLGLPPEHQSADVTESEALALRDQIATTPLGTQPVGARMSGDAGGDAPRPAAAPLNTSELAASTAMIHQVWSEMIAP